MRNLAFAALGWFLLIAIALTGWFVVATPLRADILDNDLTLVYIGARVGLEHGWSHIYSLPLQHQLFTELRPHAVFNDGERFVSPPPYAWLVLPLAVLGPAGAVFGWLAISLGSLVAAWWIVVPGERPGRALWLLGSLAWYPVLYGLSLAQPDLAIVVVAALSWKLAERGRPYLAGAALGLSVIKPQLTLLLPVVLVFSGRWRIAAAWAATAAALALASLAVVGRQGLGDYIGLLDEAQRVANNRYFTLAFVLGPGALSYVAQGLVVGATAIVAYINRDAGHARVYALGVIATVLGATYWHLQDFTVLVLAAWLFWREARPAAQLWLLALVFIAGEFAWPLTPLPILLAVAGWFVLVAAAPRAAPVAA